MLQRNSKGHIQCPPLTVGLTPADLLGWYAGKIGRDYEVSAKRYGSDTMIDLAVMAYNQERFIALASGEREPETEDERELVQAVLGGVPFSLTPVGLEAEDEAAGLYPWLKRDEQGWRWHLNDIRSKAFEQPAQALRSYEAYTRTVLSAA